MMKPAWFKRKSTIGRLGGLSFVVTLLVFVSALRRGAPLSRTHDWAVVRNRFENPNNTTTETRDREAPQETESEEKRYLIFFNHAGFSNQLLGVHRAAQLAYSTNRTLVLPPILPHNNRQLRESRFPHWHSENIGNGDDYCDAIQEGDTYQDQLQQQAKLALKAKAGVPFPSYTQLMDLDRISNVTGLEFIDFPEFLQRVCDFNPNQQGTKRIAQCWSTGRDQTIDYNGDCNDGPKRKYSEMVKLFQKNFGNDRAAAIGSAFQIKNVYKSANKKLLTSQIQAFPPSPKLSCLAHYLQSKLPPQYAGLHIRFHDFEDLDDTCRTPPITTLYRQAMSQLEHATPTDYTNVHNNSSATGPAIMSNGNDVAPSTILIGYSNKGAQNCLDRFLSARPDAKRHYRTVTVNDLWDATAEAMLSQIQVQRDTILLVLDQILVSTAPGGLGLATQHGVSVKIFAKSRSHSPW